MAHYVLLHCVCGTLAPERRPKMTQGTQVLCAVASEALLHPGQEEVADGGVSLQ